MAKYVGIVRKGVEGGVWELQTDDGARYQLRGADAGLEVDGQRVEIERKVDGGAMGIGMAGPTLVVKRWSAR